jgi:hypothetical protein
MLAAALVLALAITGISLWGVVHAQRMDAQVSSSQIYIDGTPVCVLQRGGEIIASVGICGTAGDDPGEDSLGNEGSYHGGTRSPREPRPGLPPGHPPVESIPAWDEGRGILI